MGTTIPVVLMLPPNFIHVTCIVFLIQMAYDEYVMRTISLKFPFCGTMEVNIFEIGRHLINTLCTAFDNSFQRDVADCDSCWLFAFCFSIFT